MICVQTRPLPFFEYQRFMEAERERSSGSDDRPSVSAIQRTLLNVVINVGTAVCPCSAWMAYDCVPNAA
jgi:hypothetical protein